MRMLFSVHGYKSAWRIGGPGISMSSLAETPVQQVIVAKAFWPLPMFLRLRYPAVSAQ